jgi:hypothetical protein
MKQTKLKNRKYLVSTGLLVLAIIIALPSCSRKMTFQNSRVVPGATGSVKVKKGNNNNYQVEVKTLNLAKPGDLTPAKTVYVVWMNTEENTVRNIGNIESSSGILSQTLKGGLKATATSKPTSFFITAENDGNIQYPGDQVVLRTK